MMSDKDKNDSFVIGLGLIKITNEFLKDALHLPKTTEILDIKVDKESFDYHKYTPGIILKIRDEEKLKLNTLKNMQLAYVCPVFENGEIIEYI